MQKNVEHVEDTPSESQGLIKTPRQLIVTIILAFLIPIIGILLLVKLVAVTSPMGAGSRAQSTDSIAERIQPVASFRLVAAAGGDEGGEARTGEQVYNLTCATCHAAGVAGAPLFGDEAAWAPLIDSGFDEMVRIAIQGVGAMPPRGGNPSLSDLEMARAVAFMANNAGASFEEPSDDGAAAEAAGDDATQDAAAEAEAAPAAAADAGTASEAPQQAATASPDPEEVQQILTKNACLACHAVENRMIGPAYREVAEKYAGDAAASETIAQHIKGGSSGIWGAIPMPPNPAITDDELTKVVDWIMAGAPLEAAAAAPAEAPAAETEVAEEAAPAAEEEAAAEDSADEAQTAAADSPDPAEVQQILTKNACLACHATENRMIGPAYREVAEKYAGDAGAAETIAQHIKGGSSGIWGPIPMPPNAAITDDELTKVVDWIMAGAPE